MRCPGESFVGWASVTSPRAGGHSRAATVADPEIDQSGSNRAANVGNRLAQPRGVDSGGSRDTA